VMASAEIERLEDENTRLRSAAEQALMIAETMLGNLPAADRAEVQATVTAITEMMESPRD